MLSQMGPPSKIKRWGARIFNFLCQADEQKFKLWNTLNSTQYAFEYTKILSWLGAEFLLVSMAILDVLYGVVVRGCTFTYTRDWLPETVCTAPWQTIYPNPSWPKKLCWPEHSAVHSGDLISPHLYTFLTVSKELTFSGSSVDSLRHDAMDLGWNESRLFSACGRLKE